MRAVEKIDSKLWEVASFLHAHPEISSQEYRAVEILGALLRRHGFDVTTPYGGLSTAFRADPPQRKEGPKIAFLAEYDALPEVGHACGHSLIAAMSVGAAIAFKEGVPDLSAGIVVIGTPEEERGGGKIKLLEAGAFQDITMSMMVHPSNVTEVAQHALSLMEVEVEFFGKASHAAAAPERGVNALDAVISLFNGVNALRQSLRSDARIHGVIRKGGEAPNVIPEYSSAHFLLRASDIDYTEYLLSRFRGIVEGAEKATGAEAKVSVNDRVYQPFKPSLPLAAIFERKLRELGVEVDGGESQGFGSSDIGNLSQVMPTIHPTLSIAPSEVVCHSLSFAEAAASERAHQQMRVGAEALALTALEVLEDPSQLKGILDDFRSRHSVTSP